MVAFVLLQIALCGFLQTDLEGIVIASNYICNILTGANNTIGKKFPMTTVYNIHDKPEKLYIVGHRTMIYFASGCPCDNNQIYQCADFARNNGYGIVIVKPSIKLNFYKEYVSMAKGSTHRTVYIRADDLRSILSYNDIRDLPIGFYIENDGKLISIEYLKAK